MSLNLPHGERFLTVYGEKKSLTVRELVNDTYGAMNETANPLYFLNFEINTKIFNSSPDGYKAPR
jgi:hypothetical protein